jgi:hypothetical protein
MELPLKRVTHYLFGDEFRILMVSAAKTWQPEPWFRRLAADRPLGSLQFEEIEACNKMMPSRISARGVQPRSVVNSARGDRTVL